MSRPRLRPGSDSKDRIEMLDSGAARAPVKARRFFQRIRDWTWIKQTIYSDYLVPWAMKVGFTAPVIYVVDGFAGRGGYADEETGERAIGTPVIAALRAREYNQRRPGRKMRLICVERDSENYRALAKRMAGFSDVATIYKGSFGELAGEIGAEIGDAPALILLDPIGLKAIGVSACDALLHRAGKTDVFVIVDFTIAYRAAGQLLPSGEPDSKYPGARALAANVDDFFGGTRDWLPIIRSGRRSESIERLLIDLYFENVLGGRFKYKAPYPVRRHYTAPPRYWIVNAADVLDAFELFTDEIAKIDRELYLRTYSENALPGLAEEMYERELVKRHADLEHHIRERITSAGSGGIRFGILYEELLVQHFGRVKTGAVKKAVKTLVRGEELRRDNPRAHAKLERNELIRPPDGKRLPH
jgi:three-Cys-motif partner protein